MLESLAAWVLNTYIGDYLENLNTDQLSVALLQGQVELEQVPLKQTALKKFDIPLSVKSGVLGKLALKVPLAHLRSEPWVVAISDLYVLLEPSEHLYDVEFDEQYQQNRKQQQLDALENFHKKQIQEVSGNRNPLEESQSSTGWLAYGASLVSAIVENIHLKINNVHIRYEDNRTLATPGGGGRSFCCGIRIKQMTVQSTNRVWEAGFIQRRDGENLFKVLDLNALSVYWDNNSGISMPESLADLIRLLDAAEPSEHNYVLHPISAQVRIEKNSSKFPLKTRPPIPRFRFDLEPESLKIELSKRQMIQMRCLTREWARYERSRQHRKWRPKHGVVGNAKLWWKFAMQTQLEYIRKINERRSWKYATTRVQQVNAYCRAYRRRMEPISEPGTPGEGGASREPSSGGTPPAKKRNRDAEQALMKQIERDPEYTYEDLHILRDTVFRQIIRSEEQRRENELMERMETEESRDSEFVSLDSARDSVGRSKTEMMSEASVDASSYNLDSSLGSAESRAAGGGLYGWIASWFAGGEQVEESVKEMSESSGSLSYTTADSATSSELPEHLKEAEKQLEEGILDVLHESWDDSTLLRRDTLLALVQLKMKSVTLTFSDEMQKCPTGGSCTQILAGHLSEVLARLRLSPRHHSTSLDLTVMDLSAHSEILKSVANEPSLLWSGGLDTMFALGKAASPTVVVPGGLVKQPLLKCLYERRAPSTASKHTLDVYLAPISIMYHAQAYENLTKFFDTEEPSEPAEIVSEKASNAQYRTDSFPTEIKAKFRVPSLSCELRSDLSMDDGWSGGPTAPSASGAGKAVACAHLKELELNARKTEEYRMQVDMDFTGFELEDLLEGEGTPALRYLIRGGAPEANFERLRKSFLSSSCPDIAGGFDNETATIVAPSSLPVVLSPTLPDIAMVNSPTSPPSSCVSAKPSRRGSLSQLVKLNRICSMKIALTHSRHPKFSSVHNNVGCTIGANFPELHLNINQQTWVLLLEFFGVIAPPPDPLGSSRENLEEEGRKKKDKMEIRFQTNVLGLVMNTPASRCQLGSALIENVNAFIEMDENGMRVTGTGCKFQLEDETPQFSLLYPNKLYSETRDSQDLWLELFKYSRPDPKLNRDFDLSVSLGLPSATYVHCHRFFIDLLNYWLHFFQLMDVLTLMKAAAAGQNVSAESGHGTRILLKVDVTGPTTLVLPVNSLSSSVLVAEMSSMTLANNFLFASQKVDSSLLQGDTGGDVHDCLLDVMHIECQEVSLHPGVRVSSDKDILITDDVFLTAEQKSFSILRQKADCLDQPYNLCVVVERNLDGDLGHNVPDLAIHSQISNTVCLLTQDTFRIVRGFLENNLGEELPPAPSGPELIRKQDANATVITGKVWAGLSFQVEMVNVEFRCQMRSRDGDVCDVWVPHGDVQFKAANLTFESFSDGTRELDLICQKARLIDSRFEDTPVNKRGNVFERVLAVCDSQAKDKTSLLAEVHFLASKDMGPKLTILLSNVRLLVVVEWWSRALEFLVSTHEFCSPAKLERMKSNPSVVESVMPGVVVKKLSMENQRESELGITLNMRDSELVFLEDSSSKCSLAVLLKATCVLHWRESQGIPKLTLNAQQLQLLTTFMSDVQGSQCSLSDQFSLNVDVLPEETKKTTSKLLCPGLLWVDSIVHKADLALTSSLVLRLSYRDYLVVDSVWKAYSHYFLSDDTTEILDRPEQKKSPSLLLLQRISLSMGYAAFWFLDDFQDTRFPLFRVGIEKGDFDHFLTGQKPDKGQGSLRLFADYFNQSQYGWEPLIEPWSIDYLSWAIDTKAMNLQLDLKGSLVLDLNITQSLLRQMNQFWRRWPAVQQSLSADFRTGYTRSKTDHLPYLMKNLTGSPVFFTTETKVKQRGMQKWHQVDIGQSVSFSFPSRQFQTARDSTFSPHQLIIRVQGWSEIQPVSVDSVGTYFRLAKPDGSEQNISASTLSAGHVNARVVIAVTIDQDGRKVVTVRSALTFVNALPDTLELKLENVAEFALGDSVDMCVKPGEILHAPMQWAMCKISARPVGHWSVRYCKPVTWQQVDKHKMVVDFPRSCELVGEYSEQSYKMCVSVKREFYPERGERETVELPGHTVAFLPPFTVINLLPVDLNFFIPSYKINQQIPPGGKAALTLIDLKKSFDFGMAADSFRTNGLESVPPGLSSEFVAPLELIDNVNRSLRLILVLKPTRGVLKLFVAAQFWFVNKSGLPLVVKQAGTNTESAGQFEEHEKARAMLPLMLSFPEEGHNCELRVGKEAHAGYLPLWSDKFILDPGITFRQLNLLDPSGNRAPLVYNVGVEVRAGQGAYKNTQIVIVTPLYQLDNRSKHKLFVAQEREIYEPSETHLAVSPNCYLAWHWRRQDSNKFLCVKRADLHNWSAGFRIDKLHSFYLTMRDQEGVPHFLRVEVILHGAMYYCTFSDTDSLPPPIRLENWSEVPVLYRQQGCDAPYMKHIVRPHSAVDYSWDDLRQKQKVIELIAFATKPNVYDLRILGQAEPLVYENNFYITMAATFQEGFKCDSEEDRELVLEALSQGKIVLRRLMQNNQQQLWRMTVDGHLINVGSAQRQEMKGKACIVLDVLEQPSYPDDYEPLMLKPASQSRKSCQKWTFTKDNRLTCQYQGFYVQACHGMLKATVNMVLGPTKTEMKALSGVPAEQWLQKRRQKPGSGRLGVSVVHQGPTRVLKVFDLASSEKSKQKLVHNDTEGHMVSRTPSTEPTLGLELNLSLTEGIGISVINSVPEELVYCKFSGIFLSCKLNDGKYSLGGHVLEVQADNQLLIAESWPVLYVKTKYYDGNEYQTIPALRLEMQWTPMPNYDAFECFNVKVGKVALRLEEILLWKFVQFLQNSFPHHASVAIPGASESGNVMPNLDLARPDTTKARRCYFGRLEIDCPRLYLSMVTRPSNLMPPDLLALKQAWNVPLVRFDQAPVHLKSFGQSHYFETMDFLIDALQKHYTQQLKSQALKILGTVDFLGNPLGLFNDVTGGLKELIIEGSVGGFVGGVGHGVTNTVSKITSSLSEGLGKVAPDEDFSRLRDSLQQHHQEGNDALTHLYTGVKGLGIGVVGGFTSIITQTVSGAKKDGVQGMATGLIKGAVGTVTKPAQGILDFATGAASATREMVASGSHKSRLPGIRLRPTRVTKSLHGTLPPYSSQLAQAQQMLMNVGLDERNRNEMSECLSVVYVILGGPEVMALVCTEKLYVITQSHEENRIRLAIPYSHVENCCPETVNRESFLKIFEKGGQHRRVRCSSTEVANQLCQEMLYAKQQHDDQKRSLPIPETVHLD